MNKEVKEKQDQENLKKKKNRRSLNERYMQRITLVKLGKEASYKKDFVKAIKHYNSYLSLLADVKDTDVATLSPIHFDQKREQAEMLLISHIYWEMSKIMDRASNLEAEFQRCLYKFVEFSVGYNYQVVNAEMLRKFIRKSKHVHVKEFDEAYKKIYIVSSKCYIATLCFGEEHKATQEFRRFKREVLNNSSCGISFIQLYYRFSYPLTEYFLRHKWQSFFISNLCFRPSLYILYRFISAWRKKTIPPSK